MALGAIQYVAVTWTTGDVATEVKMDNMVANDQAYDSHAAQGMLLNNNVGYFQKDSGGTNREILNLDGADALQVGDGVNDITFNQLAWDDWTPSYANLTVGNGTVVAKYKQIGKTVFLNWQLICGGTTAIGNANTVSLPVAANARYGTANIDTGIGLVYANDVGTAAYGGKAQLSASTTVMRAGWDNGSGPQQNVTFPFGEASGDTFSYHGTYEAA